ncbi:hypothetical protein EDC01DRAFT_648048 [Geopyxis carbonaria]|nr:hypothetical protein EDC01DRAFT_648048 [Geopyxis carbonaria]
MSSQHPYSGSNPVPKVSNFLKEVAPGKHDKKGGGVEQPSEKEQTKAIRHGEGAKGGNRRVVKDPTTGGEVEIEDVTGDFQKAAGKPELVVPTNALPGEPDKVSQNDFAQATQSREEYAQKQDVTAPPAPLKTNTTADVPISGEKTNILVHPTPTLSLEGTVFAGFEQKVTTLCLGIFGAILVGGKLLGGGSLFSLFLISSGVAGSVWYWARGVMDEARNVDWESEKKRGEMAVTSLIPESVEWMNNLLGIVWGLVNPEMFSSIADQLEDVMQASAPGIIENVRVADISQGSNPIRILSMRSLPDSEVPDLKKAATAAREGKDEQQRRAEEDGGEVYNLEISFAYNASPVENKGVSARSRNMHLQVVFYAGIKGLFGVPLPIWVELKGLIGTVRLRLQVSPDAPFLKTLTFTLMGIPKVSVSCIPMMEKGINILDLPMISNFVNASIATAANEYVAPKSMSLELGKMLMGDDVKKDTEAVGLLWVNIEKAIGLSKQDRSGSSDAYITLAFSKYGKPMYSTRVIVDDLNPIWNESTGILINAEHIKASEGLSIELWDSDRFTADDCVGKVEIPIQDLMIESGKMHKQVSKLKGEEANSDMPGELHWSVGFFGKAQFRPALRTSGKDVNLPDALKDEPALQDDKGSLDTEKEDATMHTPPDPLFPSGIVSVVVHQIVNLEIRDQSGTYGSRKNGKEYSPGMKTGENKEEEGGKLPSAYCTVALNDQLLYRTRTKVVSSKPIFNAGTEHFVRDWRSAIVTVAVRDSRNREHDPLLGVVPLKLATLLQTTSGVTRWFPLDGGLGFGQIRLTVLFRSLELTIPPQLQGWDVGTFEFVGDQITSTLDRPTKLRFRTGGSTGKLPAKNCKSSPNGGIEWSTTVGSKHPHPLRLPVKHRYMSPVTVDIYTSGSRKPSAHAMIWLDKLIDNEPTPLSLPIWRTSNSSRLTQNYITAPGQHPSVDLEQIGTLTFTARFSPGMDPDHGRFATDNDARETFETWQACYGEGLRSTSVRQEVPRTTRHLHDASVAAMRKDLVDTAKGIDEEQANQYTDRYGKDWQAVFEDARYDLGGRERLEPEWPLQREAPKGLYHDTSNSDSDDSDSDSDSEDSDSSYHHVAADTSPATSSPANTNNPDTTYTNNNTTDIAPPNQSTGTSAKDKVTAPIAALKDYRANQKNLHRKHRGLMQWKPMRGVAFAKDEAVFGVRRLKGKLKLKGREPDVETEA